MELNKKSLLLAQATKIDEFINYLSANFAANVTIALYRYHT